MKTALTFLFVLIFCGSASTQDLPPDILADQYLLEATKALENGNPQGALWAFGKIEALDTEPSLDFLFFYGKLLVENSTALDGLLKGQSLLKQFVLNIDKDSEHYPPTPGYPDQGGPPFGVVLGVVYPINPGKSMSESVHLYIYEDRKPVMTRWDFSGYTFVEDKKTNRENLNRQPNVHPPPRKPRPQLQAGKRPARAGVPRAACCC